MGHYWKHVTVLETVQAKPKSKLDATSATIETWRGARGECGETKVLWKSQKLVGRQQATSNEQRATATEWTVWVPIDTANDVLAEKNNCSANNNKNRNGDGFNNLPETTDKSREQPAATTRRVSDCDNNNNATHSLATQSQFAQHSRILLKLMNY